MHSICSRRSLELAVALTLVLALTGSSAALSGAAPAAGLKIGALVPLTGSLSTFGSNFRRAGDLAADHLRAAGLSVTMVYADSETNAQAGIAACNRLVNLERVPAIIGAAASGVTVPVAGSCTIPNNILQISNASTSPLITALPADKGKDLLMRTAPSDTLQGVVLGKLAADLGFKTAAVIYVNNPYGQGLMGTFRKSFEQHGGKVTAAVPHDEKPAPTYVAELRRAVSGKPDVLVAISYEHALTYVKEAIENDLIKKFVFVDGTKLPDLGKILGPARVGEMYGTAPGSAKTKSLEAFNAAYKGKYGEVPPLPFITNFYDAAVVIGLAAYKTAVVDKKTLSGPNIRDNLRMVAGGPGEVIGVGAEELMKATSLLRAGRDINYEGASGAVDFDVNGDVVTPIEIWKFNAAGQITSVRLEEVEE